MSVRATRARTRWVSALCASAVLCVLGVCGCAPDPAPEAVPAAPSAQATAPDLAHDDRVAHLMPPCLRTDPFVADTSDIVAILVSKLGRGQRDALVQAKTELAQMGAEVLPELTRFFETHFKDGLNSSQLTNALAVAALMLSDDGRPLLLDGLQHPQENVRLAAVRGLARHARSADYDPLVAMMPVAGPELALEIGNTLYRVNRARLEGDLLSWFADGRYAGLWPSLFPRISDTADPVTLGRMRELVARAEGTTPWLSMQAALAHSGDAQARESIRAWLTHESADRRLVAARALDQAGLTSEIASLATKDPDPAVRAFVVQALAEHEPSEAASAHLRAASGDAVRNVRLSALGALVVRHDAAATSEVLELLRGDKSDLESALRILRTAFDSDPALAPRAFSILSHLRSGDLQPVRVDRLAIDRAIGQMPLREAAELLYRAALDGVGSIQGQRAYRWYLQQIGNIGPIGRQFVREHWDETVAPERRMDIVLASSFDKSDEARDFLLRVIDSPLATDVEILYASDLLLRIGPARRTAPILKRVALRIADPGVRAALNCLLWEWYGPES